MGLAGCGLAALVGKIGFDRIGYKYSPTKKFPCRMLGPSSKIGHRLRAMPAQNLERLSKETTKVTIIGGGIAGLSAAWWLTKNGIDDFVILDLEKEVGGNSTSGQNQYGAYPWGAHYVPIPNSESAYVRQLFEELKIIQGYNQAGLPIYDELMLCHEPQDRLFKDGSFHEGLVPKRGLQKNESDDIARFFAKMIEFRLASGKDGKMAFTIPLDLSSQDEQFIKLDKISMSDWLKENGFATRPLLWYVNYCCRDDYGSTTDNISACRRGTAANAEANAVLTWPQGNGFLVEKLRAPLARQIRTSALASQVRQVDEKVLTTYINEHEKSTVIESDWVIFAAPRFVARHVIETSSNKTTGDFDFTSLSYAPWMVANISLRRLPEAHGLAPAWDNVSYYSDSLGYVSANHQEISTRQKPVVITYYFPLSSKQPKASREELFKSSSEKWSKIIIDDLSAMHAGIEDEILSIDLWPWGHGLIRPSVGLIWGETRRQMKKVCGKILFAHSDMSGMSNFEEAQYHGVQAAKRVLGT